MAGKLPVDLGHQRRPPGSPLAGWQPAVPGWSLLRAGTDSATTMKLLHTSDWHLGATFHDRTRDADEEHALDQIVRIASGHTVDVVVISGDLFDTANPGAAEQRRWYHSLERLIDEAGVGTVLAIAGNHDSGLRLEGPRELLASRRVIVRGVLPRDAAPASCIVPVHDRAGVRVAWAALVPYLREGDLLRADEDIGVDRPQRLAQALHRRWSQVRAAVPADGLPWLAVSHAFATGGCVGGAEVPVLVEVGNLGRADLSALAEGCAYAACGHLHRPQAIAGRAHWRYSGALLPTGFDQAGLERSVVLAEIPADGTAATCTLIPLQPFRAYHRVTGTPAAVLAAIRALPMTTPDAPMPWLQALVHLTEPQPGLARMVAEAASARGWSSVATQLQRGGALAGSAAGALPMPDLERIDPAEVFRLFHRQTYGGEPAADLLRAFGDLLTTLPDEAP